MDRNAGVALPAVFDDLDVGVALYDPETGAIRDANDRLSRLYGHPIEDLRGTAVGAYAAPSTRFSPEGALRRIRAAADGDPQTFEWQVERASGELRWVRVHLNPTTIDGASFVISEVEDITEYRARERRLRLLSRIVRHNLRNKTNILQGYANRIKRAIEDESLEAELETILDVTAEVGTLSESVSQIEEIAEPDATRREPTDLRRLAYAVIEDARGDSLDADLTVDAPTEVWVVADRGLRYAIDHAVENAIRHNDRDRPSVTVTVTDEAADGRGVVRVADDGPPIPDTEIDVLDAAVEATSTYHGSGVGLWVMQWCVDSLGGELAFGENDPRGNVVSFLLPRTSAPSPER